MIRATALALMALLSACVVHPRPGVYYAPRPAVYVAPRPVYVAPPRPVYVAPPRVIVSPPRPPGVIIYR